METKNAGTLELKPVSQQAILDIILDMGGVDALTSGNFLDGSAFASGGSFDAGKAVSGANRMLTYCLGWGVVNDPPDDAVELLAALGKQTHLKQIARANWLRYIALENEEASQVIAEVMKLTFGGADGGN